jgi:hypothetical protein
MNNETKILKDWIYEETEIYFYMIGKTDTIINEIKKHSKKSILNLSKKEINGVISVVSDIIKQSMNILINKIKIKIKEDKKIGIDKKLNQGCIELLKIDLKEIQYNKLALCYFNLLVKRHNCLKDFN